MRQKVKMCRLDSNLEALAGQVLARMGLGTLCILALALGCTTPTGSALTAQSGTAEPLPAWLGDLAKLQRSPELDEAAAWLCARGSHSVVDDEVRHLVHLYDGQVRGHLVHGSRIRAQSRLAKTMEALASEINATHVGVAEGVAADGRSCTAGVAIRRQIEIAQDLPAKMMSAAPFPLALRVSGASPLQLDVYLATPNGDVEKRTFLSQHELRDVVIPAAGEGNYRLEVVVTDPRLDSPEVALLWPFVVGTPRLPPAPKVLFPDAGHGEKALSFRLQALVERLRNQQEIEPLAIAPALQKLANERAQGLAAAGTLGHRLPAGASATEELQAKHPDFAFVELGELQAQAGTLAEAFHALLASPAHRFELVRRGPTHLGAAVVRGKDALGRSLVSLVVLLARKVQTRADREWRAELYGKLNLARHNRGFLPLRDHPELGRIAQEMTSSLARRGNVQAHQVADSVQTTVGERLPELSDVRVVVARMDNPLRLVPPKAALIPQANVAGMGVAEGAGGVYLGLIVAVQDSELR